MVIGSRLAERIAASGLSFSAVARLVGVKQPTISRLVHGEQQSSVHLHKIARVLNTTSEYLSGETADPNSTAPDPPPPRTEHHVFMRVVLPPEEALEAMFRGLIRSMPDLSGDDLARELAKLLPTGFEQLQGPLRFERRDNVVAPPVVDEDQRDADRGRRRA